MAFNLPAGITEDQIRRYARLDIGIKALQPEHKELGDKIKAAFTAVGTWVIDNVVIKRSEAKSFDKAAAEAAYPFAQYPDYYKPVFDDKALPADIRAQFTSMTQRLSVEVSNVVEEG